MRFIRTIIIKILLRLLGQTYHSPLSSNEINSLLTKLANEEGLERLPDMLEQFVTTYRNQFLYTGDDRFRGAVLAMAALRERIIEKMPKNKLKRFNFKDKKEVKRKTY